MVWHPTINSFQLLNLIEPYTHVERLNQRILTAKKNSLIKMQTIKQS